MKEGREHRAPYDEFYYSNYCGMRYERNNHWLGFFGNIAGHMVQEIAPKTVLDVGCAFGFLVEALRDRGVDAYGIDISDYALSQVRTDVRSFCRLASATDDILENYDLIVCIEVLEHLASADAQTAIENICAHTHDVIFSSTSRDYAEATHINVHPTKYWVEAFAKHGFVRDLDFDASFIAPQAMRFRASRDPLYRQFAAYEQVLALRDEEVSQLRATLVEHEGRLARLNSDLTEGPGVVPKLYLDYGDGFSEKDALAFPLSQRRDGEIEWKVGIERPVRAFRLDPSTSSAFLSNFSVQVITAGLPVNLRGRDQSLVGVIQLGASSLLAVGGDPQLIWHRRLGQGDAIHVQFHYRTVDLTHLSQLVDSIAALAAERLALQRLAVKLRTSRWQWKRRAQVADKRVKRQAAGLRRIHTAMEEIRGTIHDTNKIRSQLEIALSETSSLKTELESARLEVVDLKGKLNAVYRSLSWRITHPMRTLSVRAGRSGWVRAWTWPSKRSAVAAPNLVTGGMPDEWVSTDDDPWFLLDGPYPAGWVEISYQFRTNTKWFRSCLYVDYGDGFSEANVIRLPEPDKSTGEVRFAFHLAHKARAVRLDPIDKASTFSLTDLRLRPISRWRVATAMLVFAVRSQTVPLRTVAELALHANLRSLKHRILNAYFHEQLELGRTYTEWCERYDTLTGDDRKAIHDYIATMDHKPLISVVMPVYNSQQEWLREAIESVRSQIYPHWQLCIADDASEEPGIRELLEEYCRLDQRIVAQFRKARGHISAASNSALSMAVGDYIALLDHDDTLTPHALFMVAAEIEQHPDVVLLYSDEDKIDASGRRKDPYFKSDWNLDLFLGQNMVNHLGVYRTDLVRAAGGFREGFEGSQDYDLALRIVERIEEDGIRHIPHVLYHWRTTEGSTATSLSEKGYAAQAARAALQEYCDRNSIDARVEASSLAPAFHRLVFSVPKPQPLVSVIIPTKNGRDMLERCMRSIRASEYKAIEVVIVDNASDDQSALGYLDQLRDHDVTVLDYPRPFNYSAINNFAVREAAHGDLLLFLNNDVHALDGSWLTEMVSHAVRPEVGAVGAALYYPDGTLQHGGVIMGIGGVAGHAHQMLPEGQPGYFSRAKLTQDFSAITGACLLVSRHVFTEVGGFDEEHLPIAFNDVDLCLRLRERGLRVVWTPYARLLHLESASRSRNMETPERLKEIQFMIERWPSEISCDPFYNPNLTLDRSDFSLAWPPRAMKPWRRSGVGSGSAATVYTPKPSPERDRSWLTPSG